MKIKQLFLTSGMLLGVSGVMVAEKVCKFDYSLYKLNNDTFICLEEFTDVDSGEVGYLDMHKNEYNSDFEKLDEDGETKWEKSFQIFSKKPLYLCDNKALSWETNSCTQKCSGWCNSGRFNGRYCESSGKVYDYYNCVPIDIPAP